MEPATYDILSSESSALDGVFCVMSFESCLCSANSILVVALVCFYCICIVIQTNIELYGIEVIKAFNQGEKSYARLTDKVKANAQY